MLALIAEIFGQRRGVYAAACMRSTGETSRRRGDHHGTRQTVFAQNLLDEFLYFAAAFADQADHDHFRARV